MTLILGEADVRGAVSLGRTVEVLRDGLRQEAAGEVQSVPRVNLGHDGQFFRLMPAVVGGLDLMGFKVFNGSAERGVRYLVGIIRASSGELLTLMDASYLTAVRTGATTALAVSLMSSRDHWSEVGVIGSGLEARTNLAALASVSTVDRAKVFSPRPERRQKFADELSAELGMPIEAVSSAAQAADAEVVLVATNTGAGTGVTALDHSWLREDTLVASIGSTMPSLREIDETIFGLADLVVLDTKDAIEESGDLLAAIQRDHWDPVGGQLLSHLAAHPVAGSSGLKVFKSVGTALQDILAAVAVFETAKRIGAGTEIEFLDLKLF